MATADFILDFIRAVAWPLAIAASAYLIADREA